MKVNILGAGGVGGYFGGLLAHHGCQVTFLARGAHLQAIRKNGLLVRSEGGDLHIHPAQATDSAAEAGPADLVLVCTKTTSNASALPLLPQMVASHTTVMSLQNGVDAAGQMAEFIDRQAILPATSWLSASIESTGVVRLHSKFRRVVAGEADGEISARLQAIAALFEPTGVTFEISTQIEKVLWTKFLFIAPVSALGSLARLPVSEYRAVPESRNLLTAMMGEVRAVALAQGVPLDADVIEQTLAFIDQNAPGNKPSMQKDVEAGRPFELETILGVLVRKGRQYAVATPCIEMAYASLKPALLKAIG